MSFARPITALSTLFLTAALAAANPPVAAQRGGLRYTVAVDKFENKANSAGKLGDEWSTMLTSKLHESGRFIVVAQTDMQLAALKEQLRGATVTVQGKKTAVRGQMSPIQLLVKGVITSLKEGTSDQGGGFNIAGMVIRGGQKKTEVRATLQMVDASTGALVAAKEFIGTTQKRGISLDRGGATISSSQSDNVQAAFEQAIDAVIPWMVAQLPSVHWRGSVVHVDHDRILVNRGSREGVSIGDELIAGEQEIIRDPDTGEVLDELVHERARLKVVSVTERTATCTVVSGSATQLVERMAIKYASEG